MHNIKPRFSLYLLLSLQHEHIIWLLKLINAKYMNSIPTSNYSGILQIHIVEIIGKIYLEGEFLFSGICDCKCKHAFYYFCCDQFLLAQTGLVLLLHFVLIHDWQCRKRGPHIQSNSAKRMIHKMFKASLHSVI